MKRFLIPTVLLAILINPLQASKFVPEDEYMSMVNHLVEGWDIKGEEMTKDLKNKLVGMDSKDICDIMAKTCWLCESNESNHNKAAVALIIANSTAAERKQISSYAYGMKQHYAELNQNRTMIEILWALLEVPDYQRPTVYERLRTDSLEANQSLYQYVVDLKNNFGRIDIAYMYFYYKYGGLFGRG